MINFRKHDNIKTGQQVDYQQARTVQPGNSDSMNIIPNDLIVIFIE